MEKDIRKGPGPRILISTCCNRVTDYLKHFDTHLILFFDSPKVSFILYKL